MSGSPLKLFCGLSSFSFHVFLGFLNFDSFSDFPLMTLTILMSIGQIVCKMSFIWVFSDFFFLLDWVYGFLEGGWALPPSRLSQEVVQMLAGSAKDEN